MKINKRIKGLFVFTKNIMSTYFSGLKHATGKEDCQWNINATYFKGELQDQKNKDFAKNVVLLAKYYENNVKYNFNKEI